MNTLNNIVNLWSFNPLLVTSKGLEIKNGAVESPLQKKKYCELINNEMRYSFDFQEIYRPYCALLYYFILVINSPCSESTGVSS
jgi:hypothetical protein